MCWNVWSVLSEEKLTNCLQILEDHEISIACLSESWFDAKTGPFSNIIKNAGFKLHHAYRENKKGGGVAILFKNNMSVKEGEESTSEYTSFEYVSVLLALHSKRTILILCIYRKQEISFSSFLDEYSELMDRMMIKGNSLLVVGDFNVWIEVKENVQSKKLSTLMHAYGMSQMIQEPTHRDGHTLDHVYFNEHQIEIHHEVMKDETGFKTDHFQIILDIPAANVIDTTTMISLRKLKEVDLPKFKVDLLNSYSLLDCSQSFEEVIMKYDQLSREVVNEHAPVVTRSRKPFEPAWIDQEYRKNRSMRRKAERDWKRNKTDENKEKYIEQKKVCIAMAISKRTSYYSELVGGSEHCQKSLFKIANEVLDKNTERVLPSHSDSKILADEFNEYYIDKVNKI